jgi:hypothetical protein
VPRLEQAMLCGPNRRLLSLLVWVAGFCEA